QADRSSAFLCKRTINAPFLSPSTTLMIRASAEERLIYACTRICSIRALAKLPRASESAHRSSSHVRLPGRPRLAEDVHADLQCLLDELAIALLPRGITPNGFSVLARDAFVRAAAGNSRLRNGKINHS